MRINGSILGSAKNFDTSAEVNGIFNIDEAQLLSRQGNWGGSSFPANYLSLISTFSTVVQVYNYTDLYNAVQAASGVTTTAIVLNRGTYSLSLGESLLVDLGGTGSSSLLGDLNKPIKFICAPGQVTLEWTASSNSRDGPMFYFENSESAIYGAYFKRNNNGKTLTYSTSITRGPGGAGAIYNCVFGETNSNNTWSRNYAPSPNTYSINYCSIYVGGNGLSDFHNSAAASYNYCVCNYTKGTGTTPWLNSAENVVYNSDFTITGNSTQGVYNGTYAWDSTLTRVST